MFDQRAFGIYDFNLRWRWWLEEMVMRWRWWWGWWLVRDLIIRWSFLPLLTEDVQVVLHLCEPRSLPIDVLPASFDVLNCSMPSQNGFLFLSEPLNLLLDSG
jgi:hypothetical protein